MNNYVYYLTKSSSNEKNGLVFPSEIEEENYYGIGNFFIDTQFDKELKDEYITFAIHNLELIKVVLKKNEKNKNFFDCYINEVGHFVFYADKLKKELNYVGQNGTYKNLKFLYRLRIWNTNSAEKAALDSNFYFVGASEITDG